MLYRINLYKNWHNNQSPECELKRRYDIQDGATFPSWHDTFQSVNLKSWPTNSLIRVEYKLGKIQQMLHSPSIFSNIPHKLTNFINIYDLTLTYSIVSCHEVKLEKLDFLTKKRVTVARISAHRKHLKYDAMILHEWY